MESFEQFENIERLNSLGIKTEELSPAIEYGQGTEGISDIVKEVSESGEEFKECSELLKVNIEAHEIVTDLEMVEGISNYLESVEDIRYENWIKLSLRERKDLLREIENNIASIEHRPAVDVRIELMKSDTFGYIRGDSSVIGINSLFVASNSPEMHREIIDTIIHEGRHAYQHYNVDVKPIHESLGEINSWAENFYDPKYQYYQSTGKPIMIPFRDGRRYDIDFRLYHYQPVEIDARDFASDVMSRLEAKGYVTEASKKDYTVERELT